MVVNAGRTHHKAALDFTKEDIETLFNVNLFGAFYTARAAARAFIKLGIKGSVVFTASMASYRPNKVSHGNNLLFGTHLTKYSSAFLLLHTAPQRLVCGT